MIICDIKDQAGDGGLRRVLAVIAGREEQAAEIAAQFAKQGEVVEAVWYSDSRQLLAENETRRFEAVILFQSGDEAATDADESALRSAMTDTPLYRVG
ncbi:MAG: hypothetical protein K0R17_2867 [Rariglobus sp.]|jgi:hypothetical protein|nr:hypothetical protein [Rariglobus sp.]